MSSRESMRRTVVAETTCVDASAGMRASARCTVCEGTRFGACLLHDLHNRSSRSCWRREKTPSQPRRHTQRARCRAKRSKAEEPDSHVLEIDAGLPDERSRMLSMTARICADVVWYWSPTKWWNQNLSRSDRVSMLAVAIRPFGTVTIVRSSVRMRVERRPISSTVPTCTELQEVSHAHRLVEDERQAADDVLQSLLRGQRNGDAANAESCERCCGVDPEVTEHVKQPAEIASKSATRRRAATGRGSREVAGAEVR